MAKREIKHYLGNVIYKYNDQVPWTKTDQTMADALAQCLTVNDQIMGKANDLLKLSLEVSKSVKQGNETYQKVAVMLNEAQKLAGGYVGAMELGQVSFVDKLSEATNIASDAIVSQNESLTAAHANYGRSVDFRNELVHEQEEVSEKVFGKLNDLFLLGYNDGNVATDLVSFDKAVENVRATLSVCSDRFDGQLNAVHHTNRDFELLLTRVEGQQNVWSEFCSSLVLIEYIGKLRSGVQSSSVN